MIVVDKGIQDYLENKMSRYIFPKKKIVLDFTDGHDLIDGPITIEELLWKAIDTHRKENDIECILLEFKDYNILERCMGSRVQFVELTIKKDVSVQAIRFHGTNVIPI